MFLVSWSREFRGSPRTSMIWIVGLSYVFKFLLDPILTSCEMLRFFYTSALWSWNCLLTPIFWGFGGVFPQRTSAIILTPRGTILVWKHVVSATERENQFSGSSWVQDRMKKVRIWRPSWTPSWKSDLCCDPTLLDFWYSYVIKHNWCYNKPSRNLLSQFLGSNRFCPTIIRPVMLYRWFGICPNSRCHEWSFKITSEN